MLTELDASAVRRWCSASADALVAHQAEIDALNVFPVPDGDTGTNLALTAKAALAAMAGEPPQHAAQALQAMARGAVLGARGNSGVILSQLLRGMADAVGGAGTLGPQLLHEAFGAAAIQAYAAVAEPVEGTILTVAKAMATGALGDDLAQLTRSALASAQEALRRTPEQLDVLARAGVVDAGGRGLVVVLEALTAVVTGEQTAVTSVPLPASLQTVRETGSETYGYEVQYLLDSTEDKVATLHDELAGLGDSLVVVGTGEGVWNVHVHVNDVGAAIEAGVAAGHPHRISVMRFADQIMTAPRAARTAGVAIVAVAPGEGLAHLFANEGVHVVDGGAGRNPSTAEVLAAIQAARAASVIVLPNASQVSGVVDVAAEEARREGIEVAVIPTKSPVQGLAAVAVYDAGRHFDDVVVTMAETAASTQWAEVTVAVRDALTMAGQCHAGDVLGLIGGEVVEIGSSVEDVARHLLERILSIGGELVTLLLGADADAAVGARLTAHLAESAPHAEVAVFTGGQPAYPLLIGVE